MPATKDIALAGADGRRAEQLLRAAVRHGAAVLGTLAEKAVTRLLKLPNNGGHATRLFTDDELAVLTRSLASANATADLLGRTRIRRRLAQHQRAERFAEPKGGQFAKGGGRVPAHEQTQEEFANDDHAQHVADAVRAIAGDTGIAPLHKVRAELAKRGLTDRAAQDAAIHAARRTHVSASNLEGRQGLTDEERDAAIPEDGGRLGFLGIRQHAEDAQGREHGSDGKFTGKGAGEHAATIHTAAKDWLAKGKGRPAFKDSFKPLADAFGADQAAAMKPHAGHAADALAKLTGLAADKLKPQIERAAATAGKDAGRDLFEQLRQDASGWQHHKPAALEKEITETAHGHSVGSGHINDAFDPLIERLVERHKDKLWDKLGDDADPAVIRQAEDKHRAALQDALHTAFGVTKHAERFSEPFPTDFTCFADKPLAPMSPTEALRYFLGLEPALGIDAAVWGPALERHAFTLAVATEQELLHKVKDALADFVRDGHGPTVGKTPSGYPKTLAGPKAVQAVLDEAGVTPKNPQYCEMVYRTNTMDALNTGAMREMQAPDVAEAFPAWRYVGIRDGRQGKDHEPHFDQYYPNGRSFAEVRGKRVWNCRCTMIPVYKSDWRKLQANGVTFAAFAEDTPRQEKPWSCGASALLAVARKFGIDTTEAQLRDLLGTTAVGGTSPEQLLAGARQLGLDATAQENMTLPQLERAVILGYPVLVCLQAWGSGKASVNALESGHWAVATGRDRRNIYFSDPATGDEAYIPRDEFVRRWRDVDGDGREWQQFGIVVKGLVTQ